MIETEKIFDFEVAFSFLKHDENLAFEISDLIHDRFSTFIYSEHQKELAGSDGEKTFNDVFGDKARIVIVLYRDDWGKTKWTRIEETAIRNRGHEEGYDFTLFVQLDPSAKMPKWLPKTRIYYNFDRWGVKGLAPVVEQKVQESGGQSRAETLEDQAAKIKRAFLREQERNKYLNSAEAYSDAQLEFNKLYQMLDEKTKALEDPTIYLHFGYEKQPTRKFVVRCENYSAHFTWDYAYSNSLNNSGLFVALASYDRGNQQAFFNRQMHGNNAGEKIIKQQEYNFDINVVTAEKGWSKKTKQEDFYNSEKIMNEWLQLFLEKVKKIKMEQVRNR